MWRASLKIPACLLLGVVTSVAVAWGFALRGAASADGAPISRAAWVSSDDGSVTSSDRVQRSAGEQQISFATGPARITSTEIDATAGRPYPRVAQPPGSCHPPTGEANHRDEFQLGWPRLCMWAANDTSGGGCTVNCLGNVQVVRVWPIEPEPVVARADLVEELFDPFYDYPNRRHWYVPTGILPIGLATNTGVYATAWWLVLLAPTRVRAIIRRRRGQCLACGYSLAGNTSGVCPECGRPVGPKAGAAS